MTTGSIVSEPYASKYLHKLQRNKKKTRNSFVKKQHWKCNKLTYDVKYPHWNVINLYMTLNAPIEM